MKAMKKMAAALWLCGLCVGSIWAQAPRWADKAKQAVFSVITYDGSGKMLGMGNGFFVSADGVAFSDYALFKDAKRAEVVDSKGKRLSVLEVMGANDIYDVIKFRVDVGGSAVAFLPLADNPPAPGSKVYLLPYSTQKSEAPTAGTVKEVDKLEGAYAYLTLALPLKEKMVSCPIANASGQVVGISQQATDQSAGLCYAVDARYVSSLSVNALSAGNATLSRIGIKKALPAGEDQALVALYMASTSTDKAAYEQMLDDFVAQYPASSEGYVRRATHVLTLAQDEASVLKASADLDKALEVGAEKDQVYYDRANLIYSYQSTNPETTHAGWTYERALQEIRQALAIAQLPAYSQLEANILYAMQDYAGALAAIERVNRSNLASATTFYSAALCKEMLQAPIGEVVALMDSCVSRFTPPYTEAASPYLLERARVYMDAGKPRQAMVDYDAYLKAVNGKVNDRFYYLRAQAAMQAKAFQRSIDDYKEAIQMNPGEMVYYTELSVVNMRVGYNEEAIRVLDQAIALDPAQAEPHRLKGLAYLQLKKNKDARKCLDKAKEMGDPQAGELIAKYFKK